MGYFHRFLEQISYENTELHFLAAHGIFDKSAYPQDYMRQRLLNDSYLLHVNKIQQAFVNHSIPIISLKALPFYTMSTLLNSNANVLILTFLFLISF